VALDQAYFVGPPVQVRTSGGSVFALVFLPVNGFADSDEFKQMIEEEKARRQVATATGSDERENRAIAQYESRLRRTFTDLTGRFRVEAVPVKIGITDVELIRMDDKRKLPVPIARLSADDRQWLRDNERFVSLYGPQLEKYYTTVSAATVSTPDPAKAGR
jgi:hypothetical protein